MKVLKFGGTSVGSVDSILSVKKIVEAIEEPVIVVVSALGGITDKLLKTASMATNGDVAYEREFSEIVARHLDVIQGVIPDKTKRIEVQKQVMALLDELGNIYKGVYLINDLSAKTSDTIVSYGERISSLIVSNVINEAKLFDSRKFIKTVKQLLSILYIQTTVCYSDLTAKSALYFYRKQMILVSRIKQFALWIKYHISVPSQMFC